ncbi:Uncharacterised protein [uncultured archaeon]|nr:Uncharacterised protein [uncultured archaeon]
MPRRIFNFAAKRIAEWKARRKKPGTIAAQQIRTQPISIESLLDSQIYFHSELKTRSPSPPGHRTSFVYKARFRLHEKFLSKYRGGIKVFADIGCALAQGAPSTTEAGKALGPDAKIYAVDVFPLPSNMEPKGFIPVVHSISESRLPFNFQCDAIRLANVARHMTRHQNMNALRNIHESLREGGFLLGATHDHEFILQKSGEGFQLVVEW